MHRVIICGTVAVCTALYACYCHYSQRQHNVNHRYRNRPNNRQTDCISHLNIDCCICKDRLGSRTPYILTCCNSHFHARCIEPLLREGSRYCPKCAASMDKNPHFYPQLYA